MKKAWLGLILATACGVSGLAACSDDGDETNQGSGGQSASSSSGTGAGGDAGGGTGGGDTGDAQTPPQGAAAVEAWLATGAYKQWACEPERHESRSPSPHGYNRICSNEVIAMNAAETTDWPTGAAGVKELYANATDAAPIGYAVYLKTAADSAGGSNVRPRPAPS